jgi:hypothetical protein
MLRKHLDWPHSTLKVQVLLIAALLMQGIDRPGTSWDLLGCEYKFEAQAVLGLTDRRDPLGIRSWTPCVCTLSQR